MESQCENEMLATLNTSFELHAVTKVRTEEAPQFHQASKTGPLAWVLLKVLIAGTIIYASTDYHYHRSREHLELSSYQSKVSTSKKYVSGNRRPHGRITMKLGGIQRDLVSSVETERVEHKVSTPLKTGDNTLISNGIEEIDDDSYKTTYHYTAPKSNEGKDQDQDRYQYFLRGHDADEFDPQIAWLASFPNSGTSFTMTMVARATNTTFATNYGTEATYGSKENPSMPIYRRHPEGPFMPDPATSFHHRQLPFGRYVITKTHCGGYCVNCGPDEYAYGYSRHREVEQGNLEQRTNLDSYRTANSPVSFLQDCASGHAVDSKRNVVNVSYPPERVSRVIHLIRNPFHNVIARFHLERKHHHDANTTQDEKWLKNHPDNYDGMKKFCEEQNNLYFDEETAFFKSSFFRKSEQSKESNTSFARRNGDHHSSTETGFGTAFNSTFTNGKSWSEIVAKVPCRGDFFRYVQWHNLLHQALDYIPHKLPVLTVYYENYQTSTFQNTANSVLEFLELKPVPGDKRGNVKWAEFHSRTDYETFFSSEEKESIRDFLGSLASFQVWGEIEHYFDSKHP